MTRGVDGIVFDLDGTLVDSRADIASSANHALSTHGFPTLPEKRIAEFVGDGAKLLIARAAGLPREAAEVAALLDTFLEYYSKHACYETTLMPGARHALEALAELPLAVLTNKPRDATDAVLQGLGIGTRFCCVVAGGDVPQLKPSPVPLLEVAKRLGANSSRLVMVGDGPQDIECGRAAGAYTVGILGGIANERALRDAQPDRLLQSLHELPELVVELESRD